MFSTGGAIHPAYRRRMMGLLLTLHRIEQVSNVLTQTQRNQIQDARDFLRREQSIEHFAPYNRTAVHIRNLERILHSIPREGYEESKG